MNDYRINANYARALFMLATDRGDADRVAEDMRMVGTVCRENRQLHAVYGNPTLPQDRKWAITADLFGSRVCATTRAFLSFVVKKNRSVNLRGISEAYLDLYRDSQGIVLAEFTTRQPADPEALDTVSRLVGQHTGKSVELLARTDSRMIGGFKLEFDHNMYDARLRTKILRLRQEFAQNDYESKL